jgi:pimeloyl-ACP methyl ester carboxylesterase
VHDLHMQAGLGNGLAGTGPVAVVLPGSGSSAEFVRRAFGPPLAAAGYALLAPEPVPGPDLVTAAVAALDDAVRRYDVRLVGGISLGAHIAARWAATTGVAAGAEACGRLAGLLLALPAWTGPPGMAAVASAQAAVEVDRYGTAGALLRARAGGGPGWVADELAVAWPGYGGGLAATLRATAAAPGPGPDQLRRIDVPVGLVAFQDDPLHPAGVATEWAALLPRCRVHWLRLADPATDRTVLGTAAVDAWQAARTRG